MTDKENIIKELSEQYNFVTPQILKTLYNLCDQYGRDPDFILYLEGETEKIKPSKVKYFDRVFGKGKIEPREYKEYKGEYVTEDFKISEFKPEEEKKKDEEEK